MTGFEQQGVTVPGGVTQAAGAVGVLGTSRPTRVGTAVSFRLGKALATAGVSVGVIDWCDGIGRAALRGALASGPAGVRPFAMMQLPIRPESRRIPVPVPSSRPTEHQRSTSPVSTRRQEAGSWRGELRRLGVLDGPDGRKLHPSPRDPLAAFAARLDLVVVVECHLRDDLWVTVEKLDALGARIMVVPGSVAEAASKGTNRMFVDGLAPVCDAADVLVALGLARVTPVV